MSFDIAILATFGLYLLRTSALILSAPIFGTSSSFTGYRVALVVSLAFVMCAATGQPLTFEVTPMVFAAMALREVAIGLAMGFVLTLLQLVVRMAGDLIGQGMGFSMASQSDPVTGLQTPLVSQIYEVIFILGFLAMNGHHVLLRALSDSFLRAPVGDIGIGEGLVALIERTFSATVEAGVTFAAPVMIMLLLLSLLVGVLARVVPQINILEMSFTLRVGLALVAMLVFAPVIAPALNQLYDMQAAWLDQLIGAVEPGGARG